MKRLNEHERDNDGFRDRERPEIYVKIIPDVRKQLPSIDLLPKNEIMEILYIYAKLHLSENRIEELKGTTLQRKLLMKRHKENYCELKSINDDLFSELKATKQSMNPSKS